MKSLLHTDRHELSGLDAHFKETMLPELIKQESVRKKYVLVGVLVAACLLLPSLWGAWYLGFEYEGRRKGKALILAAMLPFVIPFLGYAIVLLSFRKRSKTYMMDNITAALGWKHTRRVKANDLIKALTRYDVLPRHTNRYVDDGLEGVHLNRHFELRELVLTKTHLGSHVPVTVFQGFVLTFRIERSTPDTTIISRRKEPAPSRKARGRYYFADYEDTQGTVHILSTDHDVLNTVMCVRFRSAIADLEAAFPNTNMACLLRGDELHFTLAAKNKFEVDMMLGAMDNSRRVQEMLDEFSDVLKLLDIILARRRCPKTGQMDVSRIMSWD